MKGHGNTTNLRPSNLYNVFFSKRNCDEVLARLENQLNVCASGPARILWVEPELRMGFLPIVNSRVCDNPTSNFQHLNMCDMIELDGSSVPWYETTRLSILWENYSKADLTHLEFSLPKKDLLI